MAAALGMDFIMGVRADSFVVGREACEAMCTTCQEEQAALEAPIIDISRISTLGHAGSGEGPSLPSHAPSFKATQQRECPSQSQVKQRLLHWRANSILVRPRL